MGYKVSKAVVKRLPKYYRYLKQIKSKGIVRVSSSELSQITGLTPSQIRQDLNHFGGFGQQGYGYNVEELIGELQNILGMTVKYNAIILGAGNIGQAIAQYTGLSDTKFNITAIFDKSKKLVGKKISDIEVNPIDYLEPYLKKNDVHIAIIAVPLESAQELADICMDNGVKGIWNYAPLDLKVREGVRVENVHLDDSLFTLTFYLTNPWAAEKK
ncbi:redox-sensing transcriptional repressor Rex [Citroniella saccharovorans]|uniref:Redox-sensing transcriptional repressor Rex n=1 Tax=Citroniella saccharovorans TaxID=2053367 RepID=A0AAW9MYV2_9FIRM|nr:redox-sensing transcriptional repressor Rex [Citroniella saccharovorans]MEB3429812.1 redox-sensing transcriptional repressor Rex [Citroniella saccharovorans]